MSNRCNATAQLLLLRADCYTNTLAQQQDIIYCGQMGGMSTQHCVAVAVVAVYTTTNAYSAVPHTILAQKLQYLVLCYTKTAAAYHTL
jgi:hypothetical protein